MKIKSPILEQTYMTEEYLKNNLNEYIYKLARLHSHGTSPETQRTLSNPRSIELQEAKLNEKISNIKLAIVELNNKKYKPTITNQFIYNKFTYNANVNVNANANENENANANENENQTGHEISIKEPLRIVPLLLEYDEDTHPIEQCYIKPTSTKFKNIKNTIKQEKLHYYSSTSKCKRILLFNSNRTGFPCID
jgi:hypothetical protein